MSCWDAFLWISEDTTGKAKTSELPMMCFAPRLSYSKSRKWNVAAPPFSSVNSSFLGEPEVCCSPGAKLPEDESILLGKPGRFAVFNLFAQIHGDWRLFPFNLERGKHSQNWKGINRYISVRQKVVFDQILVPLHLASPSSILTLKSSPLLPQLICSKTDSLFQISIQS